MKRLSLVKVITALLICNAYIFSCAVTGTVKSETANDITEDNTSSDENEKLDFGGTVDFFGEDDIYKEEENSAPTPTDNTSVVSIKQLSFAKPGISDRKPVSTAYAPSESVKQLTQSDTTSGSDDTSDNELHIVDDYEPPVSSSSEDTHEPAVSEPEVSKPVNSVPAPIQSSSAVSSDSDIPQGVIDPPESSSTSSTVSSSASSSASSSSEPVSSSSTETSKPETKPNYDAENEILRVNNGGVEVSGSAVDIVSRIVENEVAHTFAPEAIKAQAVTAYTFAKYSNLRGKAPYCVLKDTASDSVRTLVQSVIGEGIYYNGELIQAVYSASSAGCTASSQNVWGGYIPYLQSVYCELDELYDPNYGKTVTFSEDEMRQRIANKANIQLSGDPSTWFEIQTRVENQGGKYVGNMTIGGNEYFLDNDGDTLRITGRRFREIIMDYDIRSSAFDIAYNPDSRSFTITTYGYGHGVGLSQHGANNLAKYWGWDYKRILTFYFQGTDVY